MTNDKITEINQLFNKYRVDGMIQPEVDFTYVIADHQLMMMEENYYDESEREILSQYDNPQDKYEYYLEMLNELDIQLALSGLKEHVHFLRVSDGERMFIIFVSQTDSIVLELNEGLALFKDIIFRNNELRNNKAMILNQSTGEYEEGIFEYYDKDNKS